MKFDAWAELLIGLLFLEWCLLCLRPRPAPCPERIYVIVVPMTRSVTK